MITFVLAREGPSDEGLVPHIQDLIVRAGAVEAIGQSIGSPGKSLSKLQQVRAQGLATDLVFLHRDADRVGAAARRAEIAAAAAASGLTATVVPVVPVQELEAWLLTDESAVRRVVGRPYGRVSLGLPRLSMIESTPSPKELLKSALLAASETTGRRHAQERKDFEKRRRTLLDRLDIDGPIRQLPAWRQLESDITDAVSTILAG